MGEQVGSGVNSQGKLGWSFVGDGGRGEGSMYGWDTVSSWNLQQTSIHVVRNRILTRHPAFGREIVLLICIAVVGKPGRKQALNS